MHSDPGIHCVYTLEVSQPILRNENEMEGADGIWGHHVNNVRKVLLTAADTACMSSARRHVEACFILVCMTIE